MIQPNFGKKLTEIRKAKGLTQAELATNCNIAVRTIQRIEAGVVKPRAYTVKLLSKNLEFDFLNTLEFSAEDDEKKNHTNTQWAFTRLLWGIQDLFNLKSNTMKKVTFLTLIFSLIVVGFFSLKTKITAQNKEQIDYSKFAQVHSRTVIYLLPKDQHGMISNVKDTADLRIGDYLIQEYKNKLFVNGKFKTNIVKGDTVIYYKDELIIRPSYYVMKSSYGQNLYYLFPKNQVIDNLSVQIDIENFYLGDYHIMEHDYNIYLNDEFQVKAMPGDSIFFKDGIIEVLE